MPKILTPALLLALLFAPAGCDSEDDDDDMSAETDGETEADGETDGDTETAGDGAPDPATTYTQPMPEPDRDDFTVD